MTADRGISVKRKKAGLQFWHRQGLRDQAKQILEDFLQLVSGLKIPAEQKHFLDVFEKRAPRAPSFMLRRYDYDSATPPDKKTAAILEALFRILEASAKGKPADKSDLALMTEGFNTPI